MRGVPGGTRAAGDFGEAHRQREGTAAAQVWAAAAEEVIGDDGESRYLATAEELSWARRPLANHAAGRRRPLEMGRRRAEEEDRAEGLV